MKNCTVWFYRRMVGRALVWGREGTGVQNAIGVQVARKGNLQMCQDGLLIGSLSKRQLRHAFDEVKYCVSSVK